jgi:hypothetical protein
VFYKMAFCYTVHQNISHGYLNYFISDSLQSQSIEEPTTWCPKPTETAT